MFENMNQETKEEVYQVLTDWVKEDNRCWSSPADPDKGSGDYTVRILQHIKRFLIQEELDDSVIPGLADSLNMTKEEHEQLVLQMLHDDFLHDLIQNIKMELLNMQGSSIRWSIAIMAAMLYKNMNDSNENLNILAEQILKEKI